MTSRYVPEEFARELIGASAEKRLLMYLAQSGELAVRDAEIEIPKIQAEARAEGYAAGLAAARRVVQHRYEDLRWCAKDDDCNVQAEGAALAVADIDALAVDPSGHAGPADLHDPRSEEQG